MLTLRSALPSVRLSRALKVFSMKYQVFINLEPGSNDGIGIVSLVLNKHHNKIKN